MVQDFGSDTNRVFPTSEPILLSILFCYSALVPVKNLSFPSNIPFNVAHEFFLRKILLNHHLKKYPPSESYQQSFWKWALVQLESLTRNDEVLRQSTVRWSSHFTLRMMRSTSACMHIICP